MSENNPKDDYVSTVSHMFHMLEEGRSSMEK